MPPADPAPPARVLLVCSGLDHAHRGFETFARECFEALRDEPALELELIKGSGPRGWRERSIPSVRRDSAVARGLGRALDARSFRIEAFAFGLTLQPLLARRRPDVVFLSEWDTARVLAASRSLLRQRFKLVLSNGTLAGEGFDHLDRVQDLTPAAHEYVLARGADPRRHVVLPLGFDIPPQLEWPSDEERRALRARLGLPPDATIVISVAALNRYHKRLDYLIEEVASLPDPRRFLLLVGQQEEETPGLRTLAGERLGDDGHSIRTVAPAEVADHVRAADMFALASTFEGLPRALVEASALGLPCLVHDYAVTEFALGPLRHAADLERPGALAGLIAGVSASDRAGHRAAERHRYAYENFSWDRLRPRYVELLLDVAGKLPSA
jgi:1,2-diacylglycerol 3-alpha-glucosyltransferase